MGADGRRDAARTLGNPFAVLAGLPRAAPCHRC